MDEGGGFQRADLEVEVDGTSCVDAVQQEFGQGLRARCAETRLGRSVHGDVDGLEGVRVATGHENQTMWMLGTYASLLCGIPPRLRTAAQSRRGADQGRGSR